MKRPLAVLLGLAALATGAVAVAEAEDALLKRYPYDPACAWGRVGNGKGMVVRCISEEEAKALRATPTPAVVGAKPAPSLGSTKPVAEVTPPPAPAPSEPEPAPNAPTVVEPPVQTEAEAALEVTVGPVTAEEGTLGVGKLGAPKDKYIACVQKNGGLSGKAGEVSVRFLVRGRGIAEGVSVSKRSNLSKEAAQCVADVVDRRRVGVPEAPMVAASVLIKFGKLDKPTK
jgi:hypothetical protein